ncbi:MAG: hypothetical protein HXY35_11430 [Chloroflexi bacterium]|nr:hypothetical protein [Chloroflexota bacterium]
MKKKLLILGAILVLLGTVNFAKVSFLSSRTAVPDSIPDTPEAKEIMKAIENAYDIEAEAAYTFDLKKFPDVFINDPRFPLPDSTLQTVREMTDNPSLETAGYLDYKLAYYTWGSNAILYLEEVQQKAKSENRTLTDEEKRSVVDKYGRIAPARANSPKKKIPIRFISMEITNDVATTVIDDGPRTVELTLVLVNKKWYIAAYKGLSIHP